MLATRTSGAVDLQVVGPDGVEWGRETVDLPGTANQAGVWVLTPVAVLADVPITMATSVVNFLGLMWWIYGPR